MLRVPKVSQEEVAEASRRLDAMRDDGMPNRFGGQRFGRDGGNAEAGRRLLRGEIVVRDRRRARFFASALQAEVFNAVLAARARPLGRLIDGDLAVVHASGGLFRVDSAALEQARADRFEISPTGPLFGARVDAPSGEVGEREREALERCGVALAREKVKGLRLRGGRRALRVRPEEARAQGEGGALCLAFTLPPGSYASVLVEELLEGAPDAGT